MHGSKKAGVTWEQGHQLFLETTPSQNTHTHIQIRMCVYICMNMCICIRICIYTYIYIYIYIYMSNLKAEGQCGGFESKRREA